jgi:hypothetical protein
MGTTLTRLGYGECSCPLCSGIFKADQSAVRFFHRYYRDAALFMLCPRCAARYDQSAPTERSSMQDECIRVISTCTDSPCHLGCTTYSAVMINGGDYHAAVENGTHGLDRTTYETLAVSDEAVIYINGAPVYWRGFPETVNMSNGLASGYEQYKQGVK